MTDEPSEAHRVTATYAEVSVDYAACPLVRMSGDLPGCRLECCGTGSAPDGGHHVEFLLRKEGHPAPPDLAARFPGVEARYEGDGFHAYRLHTTPCADCFHPLLRNHGFIPLKAQAAGRELHLATLVDEPAALKRLLAAFRERGATPRLDLLSSSDSGLQGEAPGPLALEGLTPRQREVLEDAYRAGYFHGKDLDVEAHARALGMCVSTYYGHLRTGAHKVLQHVLRRSEP